MRIGMTDRLKDDALRTKGLEALERHLGPVDALRFLALLSRDRLDYRSWQDERFGDMSVADIVAEMRADPIP